MNLILDRENMPPAYLKKGLLIPFFAESTFGFHIANAFLGRTSPTAFSEPPDERDATADCLA